MKKQINININYNVHSLDELKKVLDSFSGDKKLINLCVNNNTAPALSQVNQTPKEQDDKIRKIMFENGYCDLGLPSGTLWKMSLSEQYVDYKTASSVYTLPTKAQIDELLTYTKIEMLSTSVKFIAVNKQYATIQKWGYKQGGRSYNKMNGLYLFVARNNPDEDNVLCIEQRQNHTYSYSFLKAASSDMCSVLVCGHPSD